MPTSCRACASWPRGTGATIYLSDEGDASREYSFAQADGAVLLKDGAGFTVGNVVIHAGRAGARARAPELPRGRRDDHDARHQCRLSLCGAGWRRLVSRPGPD